jgi:hypothetical protein
MITPPNPRACAVRNSAPENVQQQLRNFDGNWLQKLGGRHRAGKKRGNTHN